MTLTDEFIDAYSDTMSGSCCDCPSCNHYAPDYEDHKNEPCAVMELIRAEVARHVKAACEGIANAIEDRLLPNPHQIGPAVARRAARIAREFDPQEAGRG